MSVVCIRAVSFFWGAICKMLFWGPYLVILQWIDSKPLYVIHKDATIYYILS